MDNLLSVFTNKCQSFSLTSPKKTDYSALESVASRMKYEKTSEHECFFIDYHLAYAGLFLLKDDEIKNKTTIIFLKLINNLKKLYKNNNTESKRIYMLSRLNLYCAITASSYQHYQTCHNIFTSYFVVDQDFELFKLQVTSPLKKCPHLKKIVQNYIYKWDKQIRDDIAFIDNWEKEMLLKIQTNIIYDDDLWKNTLSHIKADPCSLHQWEAEILS